jgi:hypothetical protein
VTRAARLAWTVVPGSGDGRLLIVDLRLPAGVAITSALVAARYPR